MVYNKLAATLPAVLGPNAYFDPTGGKFTKLSAAPSPADAADLYVPFTSGNMIFSIITGLEISAGNGLEVVVSPGTAFFDIPKDINSEIRVTTRIDNNTAAIHLWLDPGGNVEAVPTSTTPPAHERALYLGCVTTSGGVVTVEDGSGRMTRSGNVYWRRTGDYGAPADTPPAHVQFLNLTKTGTYLWDGTAYRLLTPYDLAGGCIGAPTASQELLAFAAVRPFTVVGSTATTAIARAAAPAAAQYDIILYKNGVEFGRIRFAASSANGAGVGVTTTSFAIGDVLTALAPAYVDATIASIRLTVAGMV